MGNLEHDFVRIKTCSSIIWILNTGSRVQDNLCQCETTRGGIPFLHGYTTSKEFEGWLAKMGLEQMGPDRAIPDMSAMMKRMGLAAE